MTLKKLLLTLISLPLAILTACHTDTGNYSIMTVDGAIPSGQIGTTLAHEHILVDWIGADSTGYHRWDREEVVEKMLPFVEEAKEAGIETIFEYTPEYLGRDPYILYSLMQRSGVNFVTNVGYYGAVDNRFIPRLAYRSTATEIAGRWISQTMNGIDGSGIRPGFIKISVAEETELSDLHQKIVEAAAITHLETGLTIASHTVGDIPAMAQIDFLKEQGVSPNAWIWTHAQTGSLEGNLQAAEEGAWISLDGVNANVAEGEEGSIMWYVDRIKALRDEGYLSQVLLSHDAGWYKPEEPNGGEVRPYTDLSEHLVPAMLENGFTPYEINRLLVKNPQDAYGIRIRAVES
jgi:phosphotriesterase-related protein